MHQQQHTLLDPSALGQLYNLGNLQAQYPSDPARQDLITALIVFPLFGGPFCIWLWGFLSHIQTEGIIGGCMGVFTGTWFVLFGLALKASASKVLYERKYGQLNILVYDDGFLYWRNKGKVEHAIRWEDIESVHHSYGGSGENGPSHGYSITTKHGEKLALSHIGPRGFSATVELATINHRYLRAQADYLTGRVVQFGRLKVSLRGLNDEARMLSWNDVERISISEVDGAAQIKKKGEKRKWASFTIGELNNVKVLERLITADIRPVYGLEFTFISWT